VLSVALDEVRRDEGDDQQGAKEHEKIHV
jgi:hypothetical protein